MKTQQNKQFFGYSAKSLLPEFNNKEFCIEKCGYLWQGFFSGGKERLANCLKNCDNKYSSVGINEIDYGNGVSVSSSSSVTVNPQEDFKNDIKKSSYILAIIGVLIVLKVRSKIKKKSKK